MRELDLELALMLELELELREEEKLTQQLPMRRNRELARPVAD